MLGRHERLSQTDVKQALNSKRLFCVLGTLYVYPLPLSSPPPRFAVGVAFAKHLGKLKSHARHELKRAVYAAFEPKNVHFKRPYGILIMLKQDYSGHPQDLTLAVREQVFPLLDSLS